MAKERRGGIFQILPVQLSSSPSCKAFNYYYYLNMFSNSLTSASRSLLVPGARPCSPPWFPSPPSVPAASNQAGRRPECQAHYFILSASWKTFAFWEVTLLSSANLWRKQDMKAGLGFEAQTGLCPHLQLVDPSGSGAPRGSSSSRGSLSSVRATPNWPLNAMSLS